MLTFEETLILLDRNTKFVCVGIHPNLATCYGFRFNNNEVGGSEFTKEFANWIVTKIAPIKDIDGASGIDISLDPPDEKDYDVQAMLTRAREYDENQVHSVEDLYKEFRKTMDVIQEMMSELSKKLDGGSKK